MDVMGLVQVLDVFELNPLCEIIAVVYKKGIYL